MPDLLPEHLAPDAVLEPATGEIVSLRDASDHAIVLASEQLAAIDTHIYMRKRALAAELRERHGVGTTEAGGYRFKVAESQSWPKGATLDALEKLLASGALTIADAERAMPATPTPDGRALKSLIGRLMVSDPDSARVLASACTVSPPSVREIKAMAVEGREG